MQEHAPVVSQHVMAPRSPVAPQPPVVSDNLYISDLPTNVDEATLQEIFGKYGNVKQCRVLQAGAALIRFGSESEATWIVENVNNNIPQGLATPVKVKYAEANRGGPSQGGAGGKGGDWGWGKGWGKGGFGMYGGMGGMWDASGWGWAPKNARDLIRSLVAQQKLPGGARKENDGSTLFIGGLPENTTDLDLYHIFSPFGAIASRGATARLDKDSGNCTGIGFINFLEQESANNSIRVLNGTLMSDGSTLSVKIKGPSKEPKGQGKGFSDLVNVPGPRQPYMAAPPPPGPSQPYMAAPPPPGPMPAGPGMQC